MDPADLHGERVALLLVSVDEGGNSLGEDVAVLIARVHWDGSTLRLLTGADEPPIVVDPDRYDGILPAESLEMAEELKAPFYTVLRVRPLPDGAAESGEYTRLGWKWPEEPPAEPWQGS